MPSYKELGLVNTKELFKKAMAGHYAIPAYNFNNMEQLQAIIQACVETKSPVILQVNKLYMLMVLVETAPYLHVKITLVEDRARSPPTHTA